MTDPFRSAVRRRLLDLVVAEPGITLPEAGRRLGCRSTNIRYHFRVLVAAGLGEIRQERGIQHLYPTKAATLSVQQHQLLTNSFNRAVVEVVVSQPGIPRGTLARVLGVTTTRLTRRIQLLQDAGILVCYRNAVAIHHFPTGAAVKALRALEV